MNDIYLNSELKKFYLQDFNEILLSDNSFWKIEDSISEHLTLINKNTNIQTLYSMNGKGKILSDSYLEFCYTKEVENIIFKEFLPKLLNVFSSKGNCCIYKFCYPRDNANYKKNSNSKYSCVANMDHFRINHIRIDYKPGLKGNGHDEFWKYLAQQLSKL